MRFEYTTASPPGFAETEVMSQGVGDRERVAARTGERDLRITRSQAVAQPV